MRSTSLVALAFAPLLLLLREPQLTEARRSPSAASLLVSPDWLKAHLEEPDLVLLEVGSNEEYHSGHIRRARPVDLLAFHGHGSGMPEASQFVSAIQALGISNSSRIVLYGANMATSLLWVVFEYVGLGDRTMVLDGGKPGWNTAGHDLTMENPTYLAGKFVPTPQPEFIVNAEWILNRLEDPRLALLDARSPAEYTGEPDPGIIRPGHIPGAANLDWEVTFDSTGHLKPAHELRALVTQAGFEPGDQLVVYCTVGMRASHLYFVARHLGLAPRLYLGSMNDWASDPSRPVTRSQGR